MSDMQGQEKKNQNRKMFSQIAHKYDFMNRVMTIGQDIQWRKELVKKLSLSHPSIVMDIGCGTGDLAREVRKQHPDSMVIAADLTFEMIQQGVNKTEDPLIHWVIADAQNLPFEKERFDAVVSGYLLRNVPDIAVTLKEQYRVSKLGAWIASLDTTPPEKNWMLPILNFYLNKIIPVFGYFTLGDSSAYEYLSSSTQQFLDAISLAEKFRQSGFTEVVFIKKMFKTMAIHWGIKQ